MKQRDEPSDTQAIHDGTGISHAMRHKKGVRLAIGCA